MRINTATRAMAAAATLGVALTACSGAGDDITAQQSSRQQSGAPAHTSTTDTDAGPGQTEATQPTEQAPQQPGASTTDAPPTTTPAAETNARPGSGHGYCFDLNSALARDAIATLGTDMQGGAWQPQGASEHPLSEGCGLDWLLVNGSGVQDATYTSRVLLFAGGKYLGTVEPHEFSYTSIAGGTLNSVTVRYRWLRKDDPFCCPQGGPTEVTVTLSGGRLSRTGQFPPET
ncbi:LppP/LprE family lipoprotein [Gordonia phthalatica]|uniref:LppP/LprE family lipoprotein n=1 Tax=Gordonia phthalatica TaxID=1136941 RepID=A0A0N9NDL0_9ACTN|nr:LppP/LprE family lipoprotein [Gordonia phthalatica]ALG83638.1 hypothetical protein ACH46_02865 [Gordonia phthalatica]